MPKKLKIRVEDLSEVCHNFGTNFGPGEPRIVEISILRKWLQCQQLVGQYYEWSFFEFEDKT